MAPKRKVRNIQISRASNKNSYDNLSLSDALCPICRTVLIEPVTLPCNHGFCLSCFNNSMEYTNLACPLCRLRISSWLRLTKKDRLVNRGLWEAIQRTFSERVQEKLQGKEKCEEDDVQRQITADGEIRLEYEMQRAKELETQQREHEAELKATEDYIKKLKEQEENEECIRKENLRLSEQLARTLSSEYNIDPGPSSSKTTMISSSFNKKKQAPIDRFLVNTSKSNVSKQYTCKILNQSSSVNNSIIAKDLLTLMGKHVSKKLRDDTSDSNDSIVTECKYFKPIDRKIIPLSSKVTPLKIPAIVANANTVIIGAPKGKTSFTHSCLNSAFAMVKIMFPLSSCKDHLEVEDVNLRVNQLSDTGTSDTSVIIESNLFKTDYNLNRQPPCRPLITSLTNLNNKTHTTVSDINKVNVVLQSTSKRKRTISSPVTQDNILTKHAKLNNTISLSPVLLSSIRHSENVNCISNDISKAISNHHQEEDDFKFAMKLHKELNNSNRYPVRNNISIHYPTSRKSTRQVTLKEIIPQATSI